MICDHVFENGSSLCRRNSEILLHLNVIKTKYRTRPSDSCNIALYDFEKEPISPLAKPLLLLSTF